jgi:hypothetical protein
MTQITSTDRAATLRRSVPALAALRLGFAVLLAARPGESRLVGARELALGLGTLDAYRRGAPVSGWVGSMALADGSDALAFAVDAAREQEGRRRSLWLAAIAASGQVAEGLTAYALRRAGE